MTTQATRRGRPSAQGAAARALAASARTALEAALAQDPWHTPPPRAERAQERYWAALEREGQACVAGCAEALALDPLHSGALGTLAAMIPDASAGERLRWSQETVRRAGRALGPEMMRAFDAVAAENAAAQQRRGRKSEEAGESDLDNLWYELHARPLLLALCEQANVERACGSRTAAREIYQRVLLLSPGDNLGVRHPLLALMIEMRDLRAASALLTRFSDDHSAQMLYLHAALLRVRKRAEADAALETAVRANLHVPGLLGVPGPLPEVQWVSSGSPSEAIETANLLRPVMASAPELAHWLNHRGCEYRDVALTRLEELAASLADRDPSEMLHPPEVMTQAGFPRQGGAVISLGHTLRDWGRFPAAGSDAVGAYTYPARFVREIVHGLTRQVREVQAQFAE